MRGSKPGYPEMRDDSRRKSIMCGPKVAWWILRVVELHLEVAR
jgi:hypothetical protein